jgi:hypothetical protein
MRGIVAGCLLLVCLAGGSTGRASTPLYTVGLEADSQTTTGISGVEGAGVSPIGETPGNGLRGIGWYEKGDVPCKFESYMRNANNGGKTFFGKYWNGCVGNFGSEKTVTLDDARQFVRGIAVCDSGNLNSRIKGIRLYKAKVWKTKKVIDEVYPSKSEKRTNCKTWRKAVFCSDGAIATSAVIHWDFSGKSSQAAVGISLECQDVTWS